MHITDAKIYLSDGDVIGVCSNHTGAEVYIRADEGKLVLDSNFKHGSKRTIITSDEWEDLIFPQTVTSSKSAA